MGPTTALAGTGTTADADRGGSRSGNSFTAVLSGTALWRTSAGTTDPGFEPVKPAPKHPIEIVRCEVESAQHGKAKTRRAPQICFQVRELKQAPAELRPAHPKSAEPTLPR